MSGARRVRYEALVDISCWKGEKEGIGVDLIGPQFCHRVRYEELAVIESREGERGLGAGMICPSDRALDVFGGHLRTKSGGGHWSDMEGSAHSKRPQVRYLIGSSDGVRIRLVQYHIGLELDRFRKQTGLESERLVQIREN